MMASRTNARHRLRWLVGLVLLGLLAPAGLLGTTLAAPTDLDGAVTAAVRDSGQGTPDGVHVVAAIDQKDWSFGTAALLGTQRDDGPPKIIYYVAERRGEQWEAAVEPTAAYDSLLRQAPRGMIPDVFLDEQPKRAKGGDVGEQAWTGVNDLPLAMPFAPGTTLQLLGGPHGTVADGVALDLGVFDRSIPVLASAPGFATTPCAIEEDGGPLVVIQHENGWQTRYFHLANNAPLNKKVNRGDQIGMTSTESERNGCSGTATGPHVHFSVWRKQGGTETSIDLEGVYLGGWQIQHSPAPYEGCMEKRDQNPFAESSIVEVCRNGQFFNDGVIGTGMNITRLKPQDLIRGESAYIIVARSPVNTRIDIVAYSGVEASNRKFLATMTTSNGNKSVYRKFSVPNSVTKGDGYLCLETAQLGKLFCVGMRFK